MQAESTFTAHIYEMDGDPWARFNDRKVVKPPSEQVFGGLTPKWFLDYRYVTPIDDFLDVFLAAHFGKAVFVVDYALGHSLPVGDGVWTVDLDIDREELRKRCLKGFTDVYFAFDNVGLFDRFLERGWCKPKPIDLTIGAGGYNDYFKTDGRSLDRYGAMARVSLDKGMRYLAAFGECLEFAARIDLT